MKHAAIRDLYDYWNKLRGHRAAPERDAIEPGPIRRMLADTFILGYDPGMGHPVRLAGTRVCAIFGRELKGEPFLKLWEGQSRAPVRDLFSVVTGEAVGISAGVSGQTEERKTLELEMLILPLAHRGRLDVRVLGALLPTASPYWLGVDKVTKLSLGPLRYVGEPHDGAQHPHATSLAPSATPLRDIPALSHAPGGRIRRGLIVYDGGKTPV